MPRSLSPAAILILAFLLPNRGGAAEPVAVPAEGQPFAAELVRLSEAWELTFQADGQERVLPAADLVRWGRCVEAPGQPALVLADGGRLVASVTTGDARQFEADSPALGAVAIPRSSLSGIVFQPPAQQLAQDMLFDRITGYDGAADLLILVNRDEVTGTLQSISAEQIAWTTEIGPITVDPGRVSAILLGSPGPRAGLSAGLRVWAGFSDGSLLLAERLVRDANQLQITTVAGSPWVALPDDLVFLQTVGGRAVYLSDLPAEYRHVPYLDLDWPYRVDRSVLGGRLRAGGALYLKGLGVHAASRLSYALNGKYRRLEAALAIDDAADGGGSARFRVFVDGKEQFTSGTQRGGQPPSAMAVSVEGAARLDLVVDFADRGAVLDRADWLDARLLP